MVVVHLSLVVKLRLGVTVEPRNIRNIACPIDPKDNLPRPKNGNIEGPEIRW